MEIQGNITIQLMPQEFIRLMSIIEDHVYEYAKTGDLILEMYDKMRGLIK